MGLSRAPIGEEAGFDPINPHGASKAEAEKLFHQLAAEDPGARMLIIRPAVVYEPGNPPSTNVYRLLGKTPPSWHIPLSIATPIAKVSDVAAERTGIEFTGVNSFHSFTFVNSLRSYSITAARIEKFNRLRNLDASKIRELGFKQPVSNEEALRRAVAWHLEAAYGEAVANGEWRIED